MKTSDSERGRGFESHRWRQIKIKQGVVGMTFANRGLMVGDLLLSDIGEIYIYLGFYEGLPRSMYMMPSFGHMYLFCTSWGSLKCGYCVDPVVHNSVLDVEAHGGMLSPQASAILFQDNITRLRAGIDGNARYSKSYGKFKCRVGHVDIQPDSLQYVFGCRRIGDKKPRGYRGS